MEPWLIIAIPGAIIALVVLIILITLVVKRKRRREAAELQARHADMQQKMTILATSRLIDGVDIVQQRIDAVNRAQGHLRECSICSNRTYKDAVAAGNTIIRSDKLNKLWQRLEGSVGENRLIILVDILDTLQNDDPWLDTVAASHDSIRLDFIKSAKEWIDGISRVDLTNINSIKSRIEKYCKMAGGQSGPIDFPSNWNTMVAEGIERPTVSYFVNVPEVDFRTYIHLLRRAYAASDLATLKLLAAIAANGTAIDSDDLIYYFIVEPAEADRRIDVVDVPALLRKVVPTP